MISIWANAERRETFFAQLDALIALYPEMTDMMKRDYADDPTGSHFSGPEDGGSDPFDPNSPSMISGIVLLISTTNMQGWEDIAIHRSAHQNRFMTYGMLQSAIDVI